QEREHHDTLMTKYNCQYVSQAETEGGLAVDWILVVVNHPVLASKLLIFLSFLIRVHKSAHGCRGQEGFDFGETVLGYEQHVSGVQVRILAQVSLLFHFLHIDNLGG